MDLIGGTEGLAHAAIREYVAELVTSQLGDSGFQLRPDQVCSTGMSQPLDKVWGKAWRS